MEKIHNSYKKLFTKLKDIDIKGDYEVAHMIQDDIYTKFIKDIASGKIENKEDIVFLSKEIKKNVIIYGNNKSRWYA